MLGELFKDITGSFNELRYGEELQTITVAKPYCSPARRIITGALQPYGVKIYGIEERTEKAELRGFLRRMNIEARRWENLKFGPAAAMWLPMAIVADVTVSKKAAAWAEYLLLRTGKLYVPGRYVNKRNATWAAKHGGKMPPAWKDGKPWIEKSCSDGVNAWQPIRDAIHQERDGEAPNGNRRTARKPAKRKSGGL